jgi:hypothetical protein
LLRLPFRVLGSHLLDAIKREDKFRVHRLFHHSVPSLSKVAMRFAAGTKSGPPSFFTRVTKSRIACLVGPSFHNGSESGPFCATAVPAIAKRTRALSRNVDGPVRCRRSLPRFESLRPAWLLHQLHSTND